jgi:hypothetical protein
VKLGFKPALNKHAVNKQAGIAQSFVVCAELTLLIGLIDYIAHNGSISIAHSMGNSHDLAAELS